MSRHLVTETENPTSFLTQKHKLETDVLSRMRVLPPILHFTVITSNQK